MTEMLYLVMMKTHRNFGCLPLDGFKGITPVKKKYFKILTLFLFCFVHTDKKWDKRFLAVSNREFYNRYSF